MSARCCLLLRVVVVWCDVCCLSVGVAFVNVRLLFRVVCLYMLLDAIVCCRCLLLVIC